MNNQPTKFETLNGGAEIEVIKSDGWPEKVFVRQLPVRQMAELGKAMDDEITSAELYTGKDKAWLEALPRDSVEQIIVEGERLNADFFARWSKRRIARMELIRPGAFAKLTEAVPAVPAAPAVPS